MRISGASVGGCERGGELISHLQSYLSIKTIWKGDAPIYSSKFCEISF